MPPPFEECLDGAKLYTGEVLKDLDDCLTHDCRHIGGCIRETVGEDPGAKKLRKK